MAEFTVLFSSGRSETFEDSSYEISATNGVLTITTHDAEGTETRHHSPHHWLRIDA